MVKGLRMAAPAGEVALAAVPASAAGPGLRQLLVGSEGTLGVIDELSLRVRPRPSARIYEGVFFESFEAGVEAFRALAQEHVALPSVARLSDESETEMSLALGWQRRGQGPAGTRLSGRARLRAVGCLAILGFEGEPEEVGARRVRATRIVRREGGLPVGAARRAGRGWRSATRPPICATSCSPRA